MARNIQINYKGEDGSYEVLYPNITINNVSNLQNNLNSLQNQINKKLNLSGGTMTGSLILNGNPSSNNQAANKGYVDSQIDNSKNYTDTEITGAISDIPFRILDKKTISVNFIKENATTYNAIDFSPLFKTDKYSSSADYYSVVFLLLEFNLKMDDPFDNDYKYIEFFNYQETDFRIGPILVADNVSYKTHILGITAFSNNGQHFGFSQLFFYMPENVYKLQAFSLDNTLFSARGDSTTTDILGEISSYFITFNT